MQNFESEHLRRQILVTLGGQRVLLVGRDVGVIMTSLLNDGIDVHGLIPPEQADEALRLMPPRIFPFLGWRLPYGDKSFDTVAVIDLIDELSIDHFPEALAELSRVSRLGFMVTTFWHSIELVETLGYPLGLRRNLAQFETIGYEHLEPNQWRKAVFFEPVPSGGTSHSIEEPVALRDMSRQSGRYADAHICRYWLASHRVKEGDTVVDVDGGAGYGAALLARLTRAEKIICFNSDPVFVSYAKTHFQSGDARIEFRHTGAVNLGFVPDNAVDVVTLFESLDVSHTPEVILKEVFRILRPGGRVIASVRNMWPDHGGAVPAPYNWERFRALFQGDGWLIERQQVLTSGISGKRPTTRQILDLSPENMCPDDETEWCFLVVMKTPLLGGKSSLPDRHHASLSDNSDYHFTAWARDYDNATLLPSMIHVGQRIEDAGTLIKIAREVANEARPGSPDQGGALCVLAYQLLEAEAPWAEKLAILKDLRDYKPDGSVHARRWRISLDYVTGLLYQAGGYLKEAEVFFTKVAEVDVVSITPTLGTKTVRAHRKLADICFAQNRVEEAQAWLHRAIGEAQRLLAADWLNVYGAIDQPIMVGLREITCIAEQAALAAGTLEFFRYEACARQRFQVSFWHWPEMQTNRFYQMDIEWRRTTMEWLQHNLDLEKARADQLEEENKRLKSSSATGADLSVTDKGSR